MEKISVLIVDDNLEFCEILSEFCTTAENLELCGVAHDGIEGLEKISRLSPDVVILDIIMPHMDGISMLEALRDYPSAKKPHIIVTSAIAQEKITNTTLQLGAAYYMIKPFSFTALHNRISNITSTSVKITNHSHNGISSQATKTIIELGIPTNVLGFRYIIEALKIILSDENAYPLSKAVYAPIADNCSTTVECVESAIRKTITNLYDINSAIVDGITGKDRKPSNAKFLTAVAEKIKLESCE